MGFLTRAVNWSTQSISSASTGGAVIDCGDYVSFGLISQTTGGVSTAIGFNVGISSAALSPLVSSANLAITVQISTSVLQAYNLPAALAPWRYIQIGVGSAGSVPLQYVWVMKG